jgi:hypothetical protein
MTRTDTASLSDPTDVPATTKITLIDSGFKAEIGEVIELLESLERFRQSVLGHLHGLRLDELCVGGLEPTFDAGELVCTPQILSRDFKLIRAALLALDLDVSHYILSGVEGSIENDRTCQAAVPRRDDAALEASSRRNARGMT